MGNTPWEPVSTKLVLPEPCLGAAPTCPNHSLNTVDTAPSVDGPFWGLGLSSSTSITALLPLLSAGTAPH